jgi:hypothetical protein
VLPPRPIRSPFRPSYLLVLVVSSSLSGSNPWTTPALWTTIWIVPWRRMCSPAKAAVRYVVIARCHAICLVQDQMLLLFSAFKHHRVTDFLLNRFLRRERPLSLVCVHSGKGRSMEQSGLHCLLPAPIPFAQNHSVQHSHCLSTTRHDNKAAFKPFVAAFHDQS